MTDEGRTREQAHEIEVDASPDAVWRALTTPEGIRSWFTTKAEVEPGEGGKITYTWEEMGGMSGSGAIEAWEPGRRLRLRHITDGKGPAIVEEWTIESLDGGRSLLRFVQSDIPADPSWDGYYDSTNRGWRMYFDLLRHALAHHEGIERRAVTIMANVELDEAALWDRVTGPEGLALEGAPEVGATVRVATAEGPVDAEVLDHEPEGILVLRLPGGSDRALAILLHGGEEKSMFWAQLSAYGDDAPDAEAWTGWLEGLAG
jgi:uncharacterized protein YndB with AHSA1/START domain